MEKEYGEKLEKGTKGLSAEQNEALERFLDLERPLPNIKLDLTFSSSAGKLERQGMETESEFTRALRETEELIREIDAKSAEIDKGLEKFRGVDTYESPQNERKSLVHFIQKPSGFDKEEGSTLVKESKKGFISRFMEFGRGFTKSQKPTDTFSSSSSSQEAELDDMVNNSGISNLNSERKK